MTGTAAGKPSAAKIPSEGRPEVIVNRDALIVGDTFYLIDEIKKVEVEHMPWQNWVGFAALALAVLLYAFQSDLVMVLPWGNKKVYGLMALIGVLFGAWGRSEPAALVIDLPGKRLRVLRRSESEVKSIKKKIMEAKKANAAVET